MTKSQIVQEITKRVGDPTATAYGSDSWNYFIESLYELVPNLNENEKRYMTASTSLYKDTDSDGNVLFDPGTIDRWNDLYGVDVDGYPAKAIDREEYYKIKSNTLYSPSDNEAYYMFEANNIILLTGKKSQNILVDIYYLLDVQTLYGSASDRDTIYINNSLIYRAIPLATQKLKIQIGLGM